MTEQERLQAFQQAVAMAEQQFGVTVQSTVSARQYGAMLQVEPGQVQLALIEGWQPKTAEKPDET